MRRVVCLGWLALAVVASDVNSAAAQQDESKRIGLLNSPLLPSNLALGPFALNILLDNPKVQEDLDLSQTQKEELSKIQKNYNAKRDEVIKPIRDKQEEVKAENDKEKFVELNQSLSNKLKEYSHDLDETLTKKLLNKHQVKRNREIRLQAEGPGAFIRPEVKEDHALSDEQLEAIRRIVSDYRGDAIRNSRVPQLMMRGTEVSKDSVKTASKKNAVQQVTADLTKNRLNAMQLIKKELLPAQQEKFRSMLGRPFDFEPAKKVDDSQTTKSKNEQ